MNTNKGEGYIETALSVFLVAFVVVSLIFIFKAVTVKQDMDWFAREMLEAAVTAGRIGEETDKRYEELKNETGLEPEIEFRCKYLNASKGTVQLGDSIKVTVTLEYGIPGLGGYIQPIEIRVRKSGLSEVYWK